MKKITSVLLAFLMLTGMLAASAGAMLPFPGAELLSVTQCGEPVEGASFDLFRVNEHGGK